MVSYKDAVKLLSYREDGCLIWKKDASSRARKGDVAGTLNTRGYVLIGINKESHRAHRVVWLLHNGCYPTLSIDHINHVKSDNRIENLREVTPRQQNQNFGLNSNNVSGFTGVFWDSKSDLWRSQIQFMGRTIYLGLFEDKLEAIITRIQANKKYGFHENHGK